MPIAYTNVETLHRNLYIYIFYFDINSKRPQYMNFVINEVIQKIYILFSIILSSEKKDILFL